MVVKLSDFLNTSFSTYTENDAFNTSVVYPITLTHTTTDTPGNGIGTGLKFITETSAGNNEIGGLIEVVTTDVTSSSEDFDFVFKTMAGGNAATESLRIGSTGDLTTAGDLIVNGGQVILTATSTRDKYRVWTSSDYAIGMQNSVTFGAINNDYAMTFQMSNTANRGFWWGDTAHTVAQGAMALSTDGKLSVAHSLRLGYGESDTTTPGIDFVLDVNGSISATNIDFGNVDIGTTTGFDSWKYDGNSFDLSNETVDPRGIFVDSSGYRAYIAGFDLPTVYRYNFQTVNKIDTLLYSEELDTSSEDTQITSVFLKPNGTELYVTGLDNTSVYQYTLGTAFSLASATYTALLSVSAIDTIPVGLFFKSDGTKMYLVGQQNADVYQYNLSTAWDITSASYLQTLSLASYAKTPTAISFSDNGSILYIADSKYDSILKFTLSTAWDISTAAYTDKVDIGDANGTGLTNPTGIALSETANRLFIVCANNDKAFELDLVSPSARVSGNRLIVNNDAHIKNDLVVYQDARIHKNVEILGTTALHDNLTVTGTVGITGATTITGNLAVNSSNLTSTQTTFNLLNTGVTTLNIGSAATTTNIGSGTGTVAIGNDLTAVGNVTAAGFIGNATTADKWATARTITLGGDLTGNVSIDGSANVTLTATVAADSVALGTDTTGNYVASVGAGTSSTQTGSSGLTITGTGEGAAVTIAHADTSSATSLTATSRTYVTALTFDTYGHVTAYSTAAETVTDTNTTYSQAAVTTTGGALLRLTGSDASTDDVKFASGTNVTVAYTDANTITISSTDTDTNTTYDISSVTTTGGALLRLAAGGSGSGTDDVKFASGTNVTVAYTDANTITISANDTSVDLGTETTGNYVASITNGSYITGGDGGSAGATLTLAVDATSANTVSKVVARDSSGNFAAGTITAALSGNATTATTLATARTIAISGDVTGSATSFNGSADITISAGITADSIVNADINSAAGIVDTKLATISTAGKVSNSATTATELNTASAIVARDASGNFAAGTITAALSGNATTATTWANSRTITLGGDLSGSVSIDGSANVTLTATVAANSVALGTDTSGNYVATVGAGTPGVETSSSGLTISATAGEGTAATIAHADTSTITGAQGTAGIAAITIDGFGHVTAVTTATYLTSQSSDFATVTVTDTDSGYTWASTGSSVADTTADTITFVDGGGIDIDVDATSDAIRIQHTDTSTVSNLSATSRTYVTALTFDTYGHVTAYSTAAETVVDTNTTSLPIENSSGTSQFTATDTTGLQFAASGIASVAFDAVNYRVTVSATEADTLDSVTGRGATTANSITVGDIAVNGGDITTNQTTFGLIDTTATTVNAFGATTTLNLGYDSTAASTTNISIGATASTVTKTINLGTGGAAGSTTTINIGSASGGTTTVNNNLTVTGNLTVNGTTTTVNSTTVTVDDPIFTIGGDTAPSTDDNKDRGIEFRWHNGTSAKVGYFGFDDSTGYFTFIPDATNTSEVFSGTTGTLDVAGITGSGAVAIVSAAASTLALTSGTTGAITLDSGTTGAVNVGTGSSAKTITIGNGTGATSLVLNAGTGAINIGTNAVARTITVGNSTGASALNLNSGTGIITVDSVTGAINIGTSSNAKTITVGNTTGATAVVVNSGTGGISLNSIKWPTVDGSVGQAIVTNGAGQLSFSSVSGAGLAASSYIAVGILSADQTITAGADALISFVDYADTQVWWDATSKRFTPNIAGYYDINLSAWFASGAVSNNQTNLQIRKNGNTFAISQELINTFIGQSLMLSRMIYLNGTTDYLDFTVYTSNTTSQVLQKGTADGSGTYFTAALISSGGLTGNIVEDTTPQLGGDLDVNGKSIVSASNGNILITPNGTGYIQLDGLKWPTADGSNGYLLQTNGAGQLAWTAAGSNTTYTQSAVTTTGGALLRLTGSDASTDDVKFADGNSITVAYTDANTITINHADTSTITGAQGTAGIAAITIDGFGHVTAVTTATYLTAESDTLATVTGRGATTSTALSFTGGAVVALEDSGTNTVLYPLDIRRTSSSTPAAGIGVGMEFIVETTASNNETGAMIEAVTTDITATSEDFDLVFRTMAAGVAPDKRLTLTSAGALQLWNSASTAYHSVTSPATANRTITLPDGNVTLQTGTMALTGGTLAQFAATTSLQLLGVISDETGSGALTFATSPSFTTSILAASATMGLFDTTATTVDAFGATTTLNLGYDSTAASTTNISVGAVASATTKTVNLGTGGAASSITNVNIGASPGGTTTIASPNITISSLADTATTATHYYVETTGGNILPKTLANVKTEIVTTAAVNSAAATTVGTVTSGTWNATAITDTYLATISTAGKVSNSATTATALNTLSAIVARDGSGNFAAGTITAALTGAASSNVLKAGDTMTGQLISTLANSTTTGGGQLYLNGATGNRIDFNTNGTAAPSFTTRSVGTKLTLYPAISGSSVDYAIGINAATMWYSIPGNDGGQYFKWYGGETEVANLSGTGIFTTIGDVAVNGGNLTTTAGTFGLIDTNATTVNAFGATTTLNLGYDGTAASTTNISTGATASTVTKTVNLGTGGAASSITNINIGSNVAGTTTISSPNITISSLADTATAATHYYVETTGGNILPKTLANVKTEIVTTAAVNAAAATTVGTVTTGTWSGLFGAVSGANLTSLTAGNLSGTIPSGVLANSTVYVGTTAIALNRASLAQTLTGVSIDGSSASTTGNAATVTNGVYTTGNQSIAGIKTFTNGTASTTNTTGSVVITGGLGVSGAINAGADVTAYAASDIRLKTNIENIPDALAKVNLLNGVTYNWNDLAHEVEHKDTSVKEVGVIAQQVNDVLPEVINIRDNGYMAVRYEKMVPLLIEAIKELTEQNRQLAQRLSDLEDKN